MTAYEREKVEIDHSILWFEYDFGAKNELENDVS